MPEASGSGQTGELGIEPANVAVIVGSILAVLWCVGFALWCFMMFTMVTTGGGAANAGTVGDGHLGR